MEYLKLNLSDPSSIQFDNLYNNLSDSTLSPGFGSESYPNKYSISNKQSGGNFFDIFKIDTPCNYEKDALIAAEEKNYAVVEFFVSHNKIDNFGIADKNGNTLLHFIARDATAHNIDENLINAIVLKAKKCDKSKNFINFQNNDGDTPAIIAIKNGNNKLVNLLASAGADLSIKNKQNQYVASEESNVSEHTHTLSEEGLNKGKGLDVYSIEGKMVKPDIENIIRCFTRPQSSQLPSSDLSTDYAASNLSISHYTLSPAESMAKANANANAMTKANTNVNQPDSSIDTEQFIDKMVKQYNGHPEEKQTGGNSNRLYVDTINYNATDQDTELVLDKLLEKYAKNDGFENTDALLSELANVIKPSNVQQGGDYNSIDQTSSEVFLNNLINKYTKDQQNNVQSGGKASNASNASNDSNKHNNYITGTRKLLTYKNHRESGINMSQYSDEIGKLLNNQAEEIRNRVLKKVQSATKDNIGLANDYVSYIEGVIDEDLPGSSNLDKKVELENITSKPGNIDKFKEATEIHKKVVEKIKKLLKLEDDEVARDYKAALWKMAKEKLPKADNLEQSKEMEKLATKKVLDTIDISEAKELRQQSQKRRQEQRQEQRQDQRQKGENQGEERHRGPKRQKVTDSSYTISATSDVSVPSASNYSATSYSTVNDDSAISDLSVPYASKYSTVNDESSISSVSSASSATNNNNNLYEQDTTSETSPF